MNQADVSIYICGTKCKRWQWQKLAGKGGAEYGANIRRKKAAGIPGSFQKYGNSGGNAGKV